MIKFLPLIIFVLLLGSFSSTKAYIENNIKATSRSGNGGTSSNRVIINNNVNTGSNTSTVESSTNTTIDIDQEGEGTSEVTINGKTWKQEGPGSISIKESSDNKTSPTPSAAVTASPSATPSVEVLGVSTENNKPGMGQFMKQLFESIRQFFSNIF